MVAAAVTAKIVHGANVLNSLTDIEVGVDIAVLDRPTFDSGGFNTVVAGIKTLVVNLGGLTDYLDDEAVFRAMVGTSDVMTIAYQGDVNPNPATMTRALQAAYRHVKGKIGDTGDIGLAVSPVGNVIVEGQVSVSSTVALAGTTNGAGCQLGVLASGKTLYAACHLVALAGGAGPTVTFKVQSGTTNLFPVPTDRLALGSALSAPGAQWASLAGPIATDTFWRVVATVTGAPTTCTAICAVGIL